MSSFITGAVFFTNSNNHPKIIDIIKVQLYITQVMDGYTFDGYVAQDPNYINYLKLNNIRILVLRDLQDFTNRELADVVFCVFSNIAYIEKNNFGPPVFSIDISQFYQNRLYKELPNKLPYGL